MRFRATSVSISPTAGLYAIPPSVIAFGGAGPLFVVIHHSSTTSTWIMLRPGLCVLGFAMSWRTGCDVSNGCSRMGMATAMFVYRLGFIIIRHRTRWSPGDGRTAVACTVASTVWYKAPFTITPLPGGSIVAVRNGMCPVVWSKKAKKNSYLGS